MKIWDLKQGSDGWTRLRLGVTSSSNFGKILTPTGKKSAQVKDYSNTLLAELIVGHGEPFFKSDAMQRGNDLEPFAVAQYELVSGNRTKEVGFVTTDDGRIGASPDRLVGKDGLLEIKCPIQKKHLSNLFSDEMDSQYIPQVQGQMWLTDRSWCDWMSYHPEMPESLVRVDRDDEYIALLEEAVGELLHDMDTKIAILKDKGVSFACEVKEREVNESN